MPATETSRRSRRKATPHTILVQTLVDAQLAAALDARMDRMIAETGLDCVSRSDVVRSILRKELGQAPAPVTPAVTRQPKAKKLTPEDKATEAALENAESLLTVGKPIESIGEVRPFAAPERDVVDDLVDMVEEPNVAENPWESAK